MRLKLLIKLGVSTALIGYVLLVQVQQPGAILHTLSGLRPGPLLLALCLHLTGLYISAVRWQILLSVQEIRCRTWPLIQSYLVGGFFNLFLPTQVGGDVIRGLDTRAKGQSVARPFGVIVVERATGFLLLMALALLALGLGFSFPEKNEVTLLVAELLAALLVAASALFFPPLARLLRRIGVMGRLGKSGAMLAEFHQSLTAYAAHPGAFGHAMFWGLLLQLNYIVHFYFVGLALDLPLPLGYHFVSVPVLCVVLLLPVTFSGVGLRESGNVVFFALMGLPASQAVAFSLTGFAMTVLFGILGGVVYALRTETPAGEGQAGQLKSA
jgi:hypothetical protein